MVRVSLDVKATLWWVLFAKAGFIQKLQPVLKDFPTFTLNFQGPNIKECNFTDGTEMHIPSLS